MHDGARAVQNMELAGWNDGVGTCWIGGLERDQIKELLDIPPHLHLLTILPFGYPTATPNPNPTMNKLSFLLVKHMKKKKFIYTWPFLQDFDFLV